MKKLGLRSIATKKFRNDSNFKAPDDKVNLLNRNFNTTSINQKWVTDITYIKTSDTKWSYLCCIMDLHSKEIIGYSFMKTMSNELVLTALFNAVSFANTNLSGLIIQTDLGSQFLSNDYESQLLSLNISHSYSRKGCPQDNAPIENFLSIIKREYLNHNKLKVSQRQVK